LLLPLSDAPNPGGRPYVTYGLIAANILLYALVSLPLGTRPPDTSSPAFQAYLEVVREQLPPGVSLRAALANTSAYDLYVFEHGYKPAEPQLADLFYSLFLHGGFLHLFGNMLFLWIYGDNVEYRLGRLAYLLWYLATGVAATLFFALFASGSTVPLVGASGAISGVLGFYFLWFPRNTVRLFVFLFPFFMNVVAVRARLVLGVYLLLDNVLPFLLSSSGGGGVAHGAHIGGFLAGLAGAWIIDRRAVSSGRAGYAGDVEAGEAPESVVGADIADGNMPRAAAAYFALPADRSRNALRPEESLALGEWLAANGHADAALVVYRRHLRDYPAHATAAAAHVGAGLVQLELLGQVAPAYQHFLDALDLNPDAETAARARAALSRIAALQKYNIGRPRTRG
jgi:membrane associated rhomboid family serine protease